MRHRAQCNADSRRRMGFARRRVRASRRPIRGADRRRRGRRFVGAAWPCSFGLKLLSFSYYIYYRVAQPDEAQMLVQRIQAELKDKTGIDGRLLRKRDDPLTWMEIYEGVADAGSFELCLSAAVRAANFAAVLKTGGARQTECFEQPCA